MEHQQRCYGYVNPLRKNAFLFDYVFKWSCEARTCASGPIGILVTASRLAFMSPTPIVWEGSRRAGSHERRGKWNIRTKCFLNVKSGHRRKYSARELDVLQGGKNISRRFESRTHISLGTIYIYIFYIIYLICLVLYNFLLSLWWDNTNKTDGQTISTQSFHLKPTASSDKSWLTVM